METWTDRLFKRFHEIYGARAGIIEGTRSEWTNAIKNKSVEQIKSAIEACKQDTENLITLALFEKICIDSDNKFILDELKKKTS